MHKGETLTQFIIEEQRRTHGSGDFSGLLADIETACKRISAAVNKGDLIGALGALETENVQGETQKKLDIISNDMMVEAMQWSGHLAGMASEELEDPIQIPAQYPKGKYLALFDPLDGSSNTDVNISVGTIFSILHAPEGVTTPEVKDFLQPGTTQVCAGYALYGPSTMFVYTTGNGVNGFTLDQDIGEFVLTHPNMTVPEDTGEFAINASNARHWVGATKQYVDDCLAGETGPRGRNFNMRWVASMVAEIHRILNRGGIFLYPRDNKNPEMAGRLRLMYEANPMAMIMEQAGGAASTGTGRIMEVEPTEIHQRVGVVMGSKNEVAKVEEYYAAD